MNSSLAAANNALTWELKSNGKGFKDMVGDIKKKMGLGSVPGSSGAVTPISMNANAFAGLGGAAGGSKDAAGKSKAREMADSVNSGGQKVITINIGKMIEKIENHIMGGSKEVADDMEAQVREQFMRMLASLNGAV